MSLTDSSLGIVSLDSYRLAQYAQQVPCIICNRPNAFDLEMCRHCSAPMALSRQTSHRQSPPAMVAAIGATGVGKTVYLGMLTDILSRQDQRLRILARGAFSVSMQQQTMAALSRCEFPEKTSNEPDRWNWTHCQIRPVGRRKAFELILPDMAGEAILHETDHSGTYPVIQSMLSKCSGIMLLVDAAASAAGEQEQDFFTMKLLSYLLEQNGHKKRGWPNRPVSIIFSKADLCDTCFRDPAGFAKRHTPGLWQLCEQRLRRVNFFASGVAGACTRRGARGIAGTHVPLRVEPRGIVEPFESLIDQLKPR